MKKLSQDTEPRKKRALARLLATELEAARVSGGGGTVEVTQAARTDITNYGSDGDAPAA